jgi:2-dehydropantoate 2-reductase
MRILMIGAGAVGGFVGGRLVQAGREVDFLVRPGRAAQLSQHGLRITDGAQTDVIDARTVTASTLAEPYDLVLVSVKAQALPGAIADFEAAVGPGTAIIAFLNGINHIETLTKAFGRQAVLGGVLKVVTQLDADGAIRQFLPGASIEFGELDGTTTPRIAEITETLAIPGFTVDTPENIMEAMWAKWVFIATIGAITSLAHGSIGEAVATVGGTRFAEDTLAEAAAVARVAGYPLSPENHAATRAIATSPGAPTTSSLSRDLLADQTTEVETVLGDLITLAHASGLTIPRIEAAALTLRAHNARKAAAASKADA